MATMTKTEAKQREEFEQLIERNLARLTDYALPWTRRLSPADREYLFSKALEYAWNRREQLHSKTMLLLWWGEQLQSAAMTRTSWRCRHMDHWKWVTNRQLGSQEF